MSLHIDHKNFPPRTLSLEIKPTSTNGVIPLRSARRETKKMEKYYNPTMKNRCIGVVTYEWS